MFFTTLLGPLGSRHHQEAFPLPAPWSPCRPGHSVVVPRTWGSALCQVQSNPGHCRPQESPVTPDTLGPGLPLPLRQKTSLLSLEDVLGTELRGDKGWPSRLRAPSLCCILGGEGGALPLLSAQLRPRFQPPDVSLVLTLAGFSQSIPREGSLLVYRTQTSASAALHPGLPSTPTCLHVCSAQHPSLPCTLACPPQPAFTLSLHPPQPAHTPVLLCTQARPAPRPALTLSLPAPLFCPALQPALNPDLPHPSLPSPPAYPHPQPARIPCLPSPPACPAPWPAPPQPARTPVLFCTLACPAPGPALTPDCPHPQPAHTPSLPPPQPALCLFGFTAVPGLLSTGELQPVPGSVHSPSTEEQLRPGLWPQSELGRLPPLASVSPPVSGGAENGQPLWRLNVTCLPSGNSTPGVCQEEGGQCP